MCDRFAALRSLGETNFRVDDAVHAIYNVLQVYGSDVLSLDETDGVSFALDGWRFNLWRSNTELLVRVNDETKSGADKLDAQENAIVKLLRRTDN